ncbi:MAG TPA: phenylalanine--tRNA ligase subunit beta, partial [Nitrospiria bacterium]|nr:phenylalanine--tRNA ligase subunit beta [Nitrospiria bacterium]
MPTITIRRNELGRLAGWQITIDALETLLPLVKGELKEAGTDGDELKIELNDSNRPDWWCVEGIARQFRLHRGKPVRALPRQAGRRAGVPQIRVESPVQPLRPFLGACIARSIRVDEPLLDQLIQTQEKLAEIFGQKRRALSIGYYRLDPLVFPLTYTAVKPTAAVFTPLGMEQPLTLEAILEEHPKGREYGHLLKGSPLVPYLFDAKGRPLSLPPIVNSREVGEVRAGDRNLLIEVTGTDLRLVILLINLLAQNLVDRGATILPVEILYPNATPYGRRVTMPRDIAEPMTLTSGQVEDVLGMRLSGAEVSRALRKAGHRVSATRDGWTVTPPPYRGDVMHPVDLIEDIAMQLGYDRLKPELPATFTVGGVTQNTRLEERVRRWMIGLGFQEVMTNILSSRSDLADKMGLEPPMVEVENALSLQYAALRPWLLPSLMRVEAASGHAFYPHRIFEVGEVATIEERDGARRSRSEPHLAALLASPSAAFSELHSSLELLMLEAGVVYRLEPAAHPSFLEGRVGAVRI